MVEQRRVSELHYEIRYLTPGTQLCGMTTLLGQLQDAFELEETYPVTPMMPAEGYSATMTVWRRRQVP